MTLNRGVVAMCAAQACAQIGAFSVAALLPTLMAAWSLSNTEAGWISGIYYAAYTLVVPLLSSLTDRVDPKRVYLGSVALTAVAFPGFAWLATGFWSALLCGLPPLHLRRFRTQAEAALGPIQAGRCRTGRDAGCRAKDGILWAAGSSGFYRNGVQFGRAD